MNVCLRCGASNRPEARFCRQCRSALAPVAVQTCPHCGAVLRSNARFCRQCGQAVVAVPVTCPRCGVPVRANARFCPRCGTLLTALPSPVAVLHCPSCGAPIRPGARFCRLCSRPLAAVPRPIPPSQQPARSATGGLLPLSLLVGRYVILEKIAQGGMGAVYKAQDRQLNDKLVAVKEMSEATIAPGERKRVLESFQREAELLAHLEHPNLVRVSDRFQEDQHHYMVMEFVQGQTLQKMLEGRTEPFPEDQVLVWADQLCDALDYLHNQQPKIIYRDMKPSNVMVVDGSDTVKLIDFGIARFYKPGKRKDTVEFGTDGYAPPEQYGKSQTDERADVYALGAMLHQLLTLHDPARVLFQFPPVRSLNPKVSSRVADAITKAVKPKRDDRHPSIAAMRQALLGEGMPKPYPAAAVGKKPAPSAGRLSVTPQALDFGRVMIGGSAQPRTLQFTFPAGGQVDLSASVPWLQVSPTSLGQSGEQVTVTLKTPLLQAGRLQLGGSSFKRWAGWHTRSLVPVEQKAHGRVKAQLKYGDTLNVPVEVVVVPHPEQVAVGWAVTIAAMLIEAAVALGVLWICLLSLL